MEINWGLLLSILPLVLSVLYAIKLKKARDQVREMKSWLVVNGEIVENNEIQESSGEDTYILQYTSYLYTVKSIQYTGYIKCNLYNPEGLNQFMRKYKKGDIVKILYNPARPDESTLKRFNHDVIYELLAPVVLLFLIGIIGLAVCLM